MAIRDVVTGGFGNGTFSGTIALVVTRGYSIGEAVAEVSYICVGTVSATQPTVNSVSATQPTVNNVSGPSC